MSGTFAPIDLDTIAANQAGVATTATGQFIFETDTKQLWWDADGTGAEAKALIAELFGGNGWSAAALTVIV